MEGRDDKTIDPKKENNTPVNDVDKTVRNFNAIKHTFQELQQKNRVDGKAEIKVAIIDDVAFNIDASKQVMGRFISEDYKFTPIKYVFPQDVERFKQAILNKQVDAVLTDWDMPSKKNRGHQEGWDGAEVLDFVKEKAPNMVIAVNTAASQDKAPEFRAKGAGFIAKPVTLDALQREFLEPCIERANDLSEAVRADEIFRFPR